MSAYIVNDSTISVIVKGFEFYNASFSAEGYEPPENSWFISLDARRQSIGQYLLDRNYDSVNYRYNENTKPHDFVFRDVDIDPGMIVGCINCYNYQTCEKDIDGKDYFGTDLFHSLNQLKLAILDWYIGLDGLKKPWGIDDEIELVKRDIAK